MNAYDVIVIGGGPAGVVSALQLRRLGHRVLLIERNQIGGLARNAHSIRNLLGFPNGISGHKLSQLLKDQIRRSGASVKYEEVIEITERSGRLRVKTSKATHTARSVIIATGTVPKKLEVSGADKISSHKLFYEIADLPVHNRSMKVAVIGGGDIAFDYALQLVERGHVPFIIARGELRCLELLKVKVNERKIPWHNHTKIRSILTDRDKVAIQCNHQKFTCDLVLVAIGRRTSKPDMKASLGDGICFAGGDGGGKFRQIHIAAGKGMKAAIQIHSYLQTHA